MQIVVKNFFGRPWKNAVVEIFYINTRKLKKIQRTTNELGKAVFDSIYGGKYLIRVTAKNFVKEQIKEINEKTIVIKINAIFGWFKNLSEISDEFLCNFCKFSYSGILDRFECHFCLKHHCSTHRLPEKHKCSGNPRSPKGGYRELWSRHGRVILPK